MKRFKSITSYLAIAMIIGMGSLATSCEFVADTEEILGDRLNDNLNDGLSDGVSQGTGSDDDDGEDIPPGQ